MKTKIDIISGFLGCGKTTFIKLLAPFCIESGEKIVIIENEFGKASIDGDILKREGFSVVEITDGCICCSLKNDFKKAISEILETIRPDRIIFEPSGIFVPEELFEIIKSPEISSKCQMNSIITIIDALLFLKQRKRFTMFFENQSKHATHFVLSKVQSVNPEDIKHILAFLEELNPKAPILNKNWDSITAEDLRELLKIQKYFEEKVPLTEDRKRHQQFMTFTIETQRKYSLEELKKTLENLKSPIYGEVVRCKGSVMSYNKSYNINYVYGNITVLEDSVINNGSLVFIGENLNMPQLLKLFKVVKLKPNYIKE